MDATKIPPKTTPNVKKCTSCRRLLDAGSFTTNWRSKDGINDRCKDCVNQYRRLKYIDSPLKAKTHSPAGRPPQEDIDPEMFLWNLRNHNTRALTTMRRSRAFKYPKSPYRKMLYVQDVNTQDNFVVRIHFDAPDRVVFNIKKPNDRLVTGMVYLGAFDDRIEKIILDTLLDMDLRII